MLRYGTAAKKSGCRSYGAPTALDASTARPQQSRAKSASLCTSPVPCPSEQPAITGIAAAITAAARLTPGPRPPP
ncbi:MAG: hypothetical protein QM820_14840 [Minicystis sp.]